jgi:class 3 adenylate cyclase
VVNTASRLQSEARGGEIVMSERVAEGRGEAAGVRVPIAVKGKPEPVVAYRLTSAADATRAR